MRAAHWLSLLSFTLIGCAEKQGDLSVEMPGTVPAKSEQIAEEIVIRLKADSKGKLSSVSLNDEQLDSNVLTVFDALNRRVRELVDSPASGAQAPTEYEAVIRYDQSLDYSNVVDAIAAVSGFSDKDGTVHHLITKVKPESPESQVSRSE